MIIQGRSIPVANRGAVAVAVIVALLGAGCTGEDATPVVPASVTAPSTPHLIEPTDQMRELAEQQCLDDPNLAEGVVNAADPNDPEQILASVVVDCSEVG